MIEIFLEIPKPSPILGETTTRVVVCLNRMKGNTFAVYGEKYNDNEDGEEPFEFTMKTVTVNDVLTISPSITSVLDVLQPGTSDRITTVDSLYTAIQEVLFK